MRKLVINVDLDGVVYDFVQIMETLGARYLGRPVRPADRWNMWECWDCTMKEWIEMFHRGVIEDRLFRVGREVDGGPAGVRQLLADGHRVRFVSDKQLSDPVAAHMAMSQTIDWLGKQNLLTGTEIVFTKDKAGYEADVIVDDKPNMEWAQEGTVNLLFDQPWNHDSRAGVHPIKVHRAEGWGDVLRIVDRLARIEAHV